MLSSFLSKYDKWLFSFLIFIQLLSVWQYDYFLTTDGPAHVANAKILYELIKGNYTDFYSEYYEVNGSFFPNWTSHVFLAATIFLFKANTAEKILVSAYVILFAVSFRMVVYRLSGVKSMTAAIGIFFVFNFLVHYGFYNYSMSIALGLLFVAVWKKYSENPPLQQWAALLPLAVLMTFTHLFSWFISALVLASYFVISAFKNHLNDSPIAFITYFKKQWLTVFVIGISSVTFCYAYMQQNSAEVQYFEEEPATQWETFSSLKMLVLWDAPYESLLIQLVVFIILSLSALQVYYRVKRSEKILPGDAWLLVVVAVVSIYFLQPKFLCLGGFWSPRMSWLGWLALAAWVSGYSYGKVTETTIVVLTLTIVLALKYVRRSSEEKSNEALRDYLSAIEYVPEKATVLPLSYSHFGSEKDGVPINYWRKQFLHAFDYCGALKPVVNFTNYEASTTWFPLKWKASCNPFLLINKGNGVEAYPPDAYLSPQNSSTCSAKPDYVVTWCMNFADSTSEEWLSVNRQLKEKFKKIYTSASKRTEVWRRTKQ